MFFFLTQSRLANRRFSLGLQAFLDGDWDGALSVFEELLVEEPQDGPTQRLMEHMFATDMEVPPDWKGYRDFDF